MKKYSKIFEVCGAFALGIGMLGSNVLADDLPSIGEMHPPVVASVGERKVTVFFLKNNLKDKVQDEHVADAEIFYSPINSAKPSLNYVWKVEGDQIASVFFYDWKSSGRAGKSMYVLTKSKLSNSGFEGVTYSAMELSIIKNGDSLSVAFFSGDPSDPVLQNCNEGRDLAMGKNLVCAYKDAGSIKKYLATQDK